MSIFFLMLPGIMALAIIGLGAFRWALQSGQFEDPKGAAARILDDSDHPS